MTEESLIWPPDTRLRRLEWGRFGWMLLMVATVTVDAAVTLVTGWSPLLLWFPLLGAEAVGLQWWTKVINRERSAYFDEVKARFDRAVAGR